MLSASNFGHTSSKKWGITIKVLLNIPNWLIWPFVLLVLLYRRFRYGYAFRKIPLTKGKYAIVDPDDYERLSRYKWYANPGTRTFYAARRAPGPKNALQHRIWMHRQILNAPHFLIVDHINRNGLDNRKANLRTATYTQNCRNRKKINKNTWSQYKGVTFDSRRKKWLARIVLNRRKRHLGSFINEFQAAKAYDTAAKKYHAEFAVLNFPD